MAGSVAWFLTTETQNEMAVVLQLNQGFYKLLSAAIQTPMCFSKWWYLKLDPSLQRVVQLKVTPFALLQARRATSASRGHRLLLRCTHNGTWRANVFAAKMTAHHPPTKKFLPKRVFETEARAERSDVQTVACCVATSSWACSQEEKLATCK